MARITFGAPWLLGALALAVALAACGGGSDPAPAPTCDDTVKNGAETGVDCGGGTCQRCDDGLGCVLATDCTSGVCAGGTCRAATCDDAVKNGAETGVDCGGGTCLRCGDGLGCALATDCTSGVCDTGTCRAAACGDGVRNGAETDVDCGGLCGPCQDGRTCAADGDCRSGTCRAGRCLAAAATACSADAECASGFCTDGVCCEARCDGPCEQCNQAGRAGLCDPVPGGADPDQECADQGPASCGQSGVCSGQRTCALYAPGTTCLAASCGGATSSTLADTCDGLGACVDGGTSVCAAYTCDGATGLCRTTCAGAGDCQVGFACAGGACKEAPGSACAFDGECASGFCTDGVCCEARCGGTCEQCGAAGRRGFCDPVPVAQDPDDDCADQGAASCGLNGSCSGARACALYPAGATCAAAVCGATTSTLADTCNGLGACVDGGTQVCAPYACNAASGLCRSSCTVPGDCQAGFGCTGGLCKKLGGQACAIDAECGSGFCTDGVCCEARCGGACEKCNLTGRGGFCDPVPAGQDPDSECAVQPVATCGTTGVCSGARSCQLHAPGTVCATAACSGSTTSTLPDTCNGLGTCQDAGVQACVAYACNGATGLCRASCTVAGDCQVGFTCSGSACVAAKANGSACVAAAECQSGNCVDNVCCNGACSGLCQACSAARGSPVNGVCGNALAGTVCGAGLTCNGAGSCL